MVTIIYGDNTKASRQFLSTLLLDKPDRLTFSPDGISMTDLTQALEGTSLFSETKTVVIEDYLTKAKKSKEKDAVLAFLNTKAQEHEIILWEGKEVTKTAVKPFDKPVLKQFKLPQTLFEFLDNIKPNNTKKLISLHHKTIQTTEPELLFFMITRHLRLMLSTFDQNGEMIDEWKRLAPWQKQKLEKQAQSIGLAKLIRLHNALYSIDAKQKTGKLSTTLPSTIDFLLSTI